MNKLKEAIRDSRPVSLTLFIAVNAAILYILYFIIKNIDTVFVTAFSAVGSVLSALTPLFIGLVIAYIVAPLVNLVDSKVLSKFVFKLPDDPVKREKRLNIRRFASVIITFLILIAAIVTIIYAFAVLIVGNLFIGSFSDIFDSIASYFLTLDAGRLNLTTHVPDGLLGERIQTLMDTANAWLTDHLTATQIINTITDISGSIMNFFIGIIISIYLLKDRDFFSRIWRKFLHLTTKQKTNAIITETLGEIHTVLMRFIRGAAIDSTIVAILASIGLSILGLDYAVFIGCFAGICNIIPYFGPILGMIPAFLVGTFTDSLSTGIIAVLILFGVQQIDCNLIYPKVVGASTGLHPLFVLLAVTLAGYYGGIAGMILAVPAAGIFQISVLRWVNWLCNRKDSTDL